MPPLGGQLANFLGSVGHAEKISDRSVDVGTLDQERDADVGAPLVEAVAAKPGGDDVDGAHVAYRHLFLLWGSG